MSLQTDFSQIFRTITLTLISHPLLPLFPNFFTTVTTPISTTISHPFPKQYRPILYYEISPPSPSHLEHQLHPSHHNLPYHSSLTSLSFPTTHYSPSTASPKPRCSPAIGCRLQYADHITRNHGALHTRSWTRRLRCPPRFLCEEMDLVKWRDRGTKLRRDVWN